MEKSTVIPHGTATQRTRQSGQPNVGPRGQYRSITVPIRPIHELDVKKLRGGISELWLLAAKLFNGVARIGCVIRIRDGITTPIHPKNPARMVNLQSLGSGWTMDFAQRGVKHTIHPAKNNNYWQDAQPPPCRRVYAAMATLAIELSQSLRYLNLASELENLPPCVRNYHLSAS